MRLKILPLTANLWPRFVELFGKTGPCTRCWCMYWRIGRAYLQQAPASNKSAFRKIAKQGPPPGLLAFHNDLCVGWCQLTPRSDLAWLNRSPRLKPPDSSPVWSISCFYIRKGYRQTGVTTALVAAAIKHARSAGAPAIEAYPLDTRLSPSSTITGYVSAFLRAGFKIVARHTLSRPILRYALSSTGG